MTSPKRKYTRLAPSVWAELRALWEIGDTTLAELSERYEVSRRAIQGHLSKHSSMKGAKAAEMAAVVQKEIFDEELEDKDTLVARAKETREAAYANAVTIQNLMMAQLQIAQKKPAQAFKAATAVKMLSLAAATLERVQAVKLRALGLDKENALPDELPVLTFRDITSSELEELHLRNGDDEEDGFDATMVPVASADTETVGSHSDEADDKIVEGEEETEQDLEPVSDDKEVIATDADGYRLIRGANS
jgi:hypothetical protein